MLLCYGFKQLVICIDASSIFTLIPVCERDESIMLFNYLFQVVGSASTLMQDDHWSNLVNSAKERGCYFKVCPFSFLLLFRNRYSPGSDTTFCCCCRFWSPIPHFSATPTWSLWERSQRWTWKRGYRRWRRIWQNLKVKVVNMEKVTNSRIMVWMLMMEVVTRTRCGKNGMHHIFMGSNYCVHQLATSFYC